MIRKLFVTVLILTLAMSAASVLSFAESDDSDDSIRTVDQLKTALKEELRDGNISATEKKKLIESSSEEAVIALMDEKLEKAVSVLNEQHFTEEMRQFADCSFYGISRIDLGDGCTLVVELRDQTEDVKREVSVMPLAVSGSNEMWKDYGNRYFTAKATVDCTVTTASISLENHYVLSTNGIDENFGRAGSGIENGKGITITGIPVITDSSARTPGASDVNMYCDYTVKTISASGKQTLMGTYRLNTTVKYLAINKTGEQVKVGHTWNLVKKS